MSAKRTTWRPAHRRLPVAGLRRAVAGFMTVAFILAQVPVLDAYEAHVINVTARIVPQCDDTAVRGTKFDDVNGNGVQDSGEAGLRGWIIELRRGPYTPAFDYDGNGWHDSNDAIILEHVIVDGQACPADKTCDVNGDGDLTLASRDTAAFGDWLAARDLGNQMTDGDGRYEFHNLNFGEHLIQEVAQDGWSATTPSRRDLQVFSCTTTVDFGNRREVRTFCGDGHLQTPNDAGFNEECDDGNTTGGDGCSAQCTRENVCLHPMVLDFDRDASGVPILKGQLIDDEYAPWGIRVTAHNYNAAHPQVAIAFDSDEPTGGVNGDRIADIDLGTPNLQFGGPGNSETGDGHEPSNSAALHNLLIIPDNAVDTTPADGYVDDPNDEPAGGSLRFSSDTAFRFTSVKYIDLDYSTGEVVGYANPDGTSQLFTIPVPRRGGNSVQEIVGTSTPPIRQLKLRGRDSYAVDEVTLCPVTSCTDGHVDAGEQCDDGNRVNGDGCDNSCKPTTWCGDGAVQTPNSFAQSELCDDGAANGTTSPGCTAMCTPKGGQCDAKSPGYLKNNDGCQNGTGSSIWADEVNAISDGFSNVLSTITGPQVCTQLADNCNSGSDVDKASCKARKHLLADEADLAKGGLQFNALIAGADNGNAAFDALGLSATSTVQMALAAVEAVIANPSSTKDDLNRAAEVAGRVYTWYEEGNPARPECVLPGLGNGVREDGEQCDDANLIPWDGCSPTGTIEVALNEILANPVGFDNAAKPGGEWVELYNNAPQPVSVEGWVLYDASNNNELPITAAITDTGTTTIPVGGQLVVYRDGDGDFVLTNTGDTVRLYNGAIADGAALIDQFTWTSTKTEGDSYARVPDGTGVWQDPCPTPGEDNVAVTCDGVPVALATMTPEMIAAAEAEEPVQVPDPVPDAATFTDEQWALEFGAEEVSTADPTPDSASGGSTSESTDAPAAADDPLVETTEPTLTGEQEPLGEPGGEPVVTDAAVTETATSTEAVAGDAAGAINQTVEIVEAQGVAAGEPTPTGEPTTIEATDPAAVKDEQPILTPEPVTQATTA